MNVTATLVRRPIELPEIDAAQSRRQELAEQAAQKLGYSNLKRAVHVSTKPFARLLSGMGIEPFEVSSVRQYQKEKLEEIFRATAGVLADKRWLLRMHEIWAGIFILVVIVCAIVGGALGGFLYPIVIFVSYLLILIGLTIYTNSLRKAADWRWERIDIRNYSLPIPEFVLDRALTIKQEDKQGALGLGFFVEHLTRERLVQDPFLVVVTSSSKEEFYVDVWEEPRFEANL